MDTPVVDKIVTLMGRDVVLMFASIKIAITDE
jgi:hypothetical protein